MREKLLRVRGEKRREGKSKEREKNKLCMCAHNMCE